MFQMRQSKTKTALWSSLLAIMTARYGRENLNRLASDSKIGNGTASRIKSMKTSVGLDVLDKLSAAYKVEPWQLLFPDGDGQLLIVLKAWRHPEGREMLTVAAETILRRYGRTDDRKREQGNNAAGGAGGLR